MTLNPVGNISLMKEKLEKERIDRKIAMGKLCVAMGIDRVTYWRKMVGKVVASGNTMEFTLDELCRGFKYLGYDVNVFIGKEEFNLRF